MRTFSRLTCRDTIQVKNLAGLGVVIRDWRGEAIGALTMSVPLAQTVVELEALACRRAMQFAKEIGLT